VLDEATRRAIGAVVERFPRVVTAWVFGSVARGDATPASDLDLAVLLEGGEQAGDALALFDLAAPLERFAPSGHVDIVILGVQGPVFRHRVLREGVLVRDAEKEVRWDFEGRTTSEYLDWKPTHDLAMRSTLAGLSDRFARGGR
jgi:predicted nucleotidyltransferase